MAYATQVTISTGNKVSLNYQSQEVSVTLTYQIEREDADVLTVVKEKTLELAQAHRTAWQTLHDAKVSAVTQRELQKPETMPAMPHPNVETTQDAAQALETPSESSQTSEVLSGSMVSSPRIMPGQLAALLLLLTEGKWSEERRRDYLRERFSCDHVDDLSADQAREWLLELQRAEREAAQQRRLENAQRNGRT